MFRRIAALVVICVACALPARAQSDAFDIRQAQIVNAPDVRTWPVTTALTNMSFDGSTTRVNFTKRDGPNRWPDVTPAGWSGPLEYTLWLFVQVDGQWVGSGFIQFWNGRDGSGSSGDPDVPSLYDKHWYYAQRWSPIFGHGQLRPGEQVGFMVSSGNARDGVGPFGPQERSNVVVLQATDRGSFDFPASAPQPIPAPQPQPQPAPTPVPAPQPAPVPQPVPAPAPLPSSDLLVLLARLDQCVAGIQNVQTDLAASRVENREFFDAVRSEWKNILKYAAPVVGAIFAGRATK